VWEHAGEHGGAGGVAYGRHDVAVVEPRPRGDELRGDLLHPGKGLPGLVVGADHQEVRSSSRLRLSFRGGAAQPQQGRSRDGCGRCAATLEEFSSVHWLLLIYASHPWSVDRLPRQRVFAPC
jgi:hypothetical protein